MRRSRDLRDAKDRSAAEEIAKVLVPDGHQHHGQGRRTRAAVRVGHRRRRRRPPCTAQTGIEVDRRKLQLDEPIKIGRHAHDPDEAAPRRGVRDHGRGRRRS